MSDVPPDGGRDETDAGWAAPATPPPPPQPPPPSAPLPPPAPGAPVGPPVKRRKTWLVVLLSVIGLGIVVAIAGTVLFVDRTLPPLDAANDFLDDLADSRVDRAAEQLCSPDREDAEDAIGEVTGRFPGGDELFVNPLGVDRDGNRAWVEFTITDGNDNDDDRTYRLPLRQEDGEWRPCPGDGVGVERS